MTANNFKSAIISARNTLSDTVDITPLNDAIAIDLRNNLEINTCEYDNKHAHVEDNLVTYDGLYTMRLDYAKRITKTFQLHIAYVVQQTVKNVSQHFVKSNQFK